MKDGWGWLKCEHSHESVYKQLYLNAKRLIFRIQDIDFSLTSGEPYIVCTLWLWLNRSRIKKKKKTFSVSWIHQSFLLWNTKMSAKLDENTLFQNPALQKTCQPTRRQQIQTHKLIDRQRAALIGYIFWFTKTFISTL